MCVCVCVCDYFQGVIGGVQLPAYEAHIAFVQQFFVDFNLHGMNFVDLAEASARAPLPEVRTILLVCVP